MDEHRPYHTKRPHKKSRSGCLTCKKRKVKCNEARPVCGNCALRSSDCVYPGPATTQAATPASRSATPPSLSGSSYQGDAQARRGGTVSSSSNAPLDGTVSVVREPMFIPAPISDATDLKLMWYYTTNTFASFLTIRDAPMERVDEILKVTIPAYAFEHPFLMDTLLSLSAIQLQHHHKEARGLFNVEPARIYNYRARAFEGYRHAVEAARPETYSALMACSLLLIGIASQSFREPGGKDLYLLDWMVLWRGIGLVFELIKAKGLWQSGIAELFFRPPIDLDQASLHIPNNLLFMVSSTIASSASALSIPGAAIPAGLDEYDTETDADAAVSRATYYSALQYLGALYHELRNGLTGQFNLLAITWFTFLPRPFIAMAQARRPRALIILAHYLMFLKLVRGTWWVEGISDREIPSIAHFLQSLDSRVRDWARPYMSRPMAVLLASTPTDIGRIILEDPNWTPPPPRRLSHLPLEPPIAFVPEDDDARPAAGPFLVNNQGKLTAYNTETSSFVEIGSNSASTSTVSPHQKPGQNTFMTTVSSSLSPVSDSTSPTGSGSMADLEDVQMDQLHLDSALRYGSMDIVLGNLRGEKSEDPW